MKNYDYGIVGNCSTAALISSDCSIVWLCLPNFDSASLFAKILDEHKGGFFKISAVNLVKIKQEYILHTAILRTVFETKDGIFEINDYMPRFETFRGEHYCPPEIHRRIKVVSGRPRVTIALDARPNYALGGADYTVKDNYLKITSQKAPIKIPDNVTPNPRYTCARNPTHLIPLLDIMDTIPSIRTLNPHPQPKATPKKPTSNFIRTPSK